MFVLLFILILLCRPTRVIVNKYTISELLIVKNRYKKVIEYTNIQLITEHIIDKVVYLQYTNKYSYVLHKDNKYIVKPILYILHEVLSHCDINYDDKLHHGVINIGLCEN